MFRYAWIFERDSFMVSLNFFRVSVVTFGVRTRRTSSGCFCAIMRTVFACLFQKFLFAALLWTAFEAITPTRQIPAVFFLTRREKYGDRTVR